MAGAAHHSLNFDKESAVHYYLCILFDVPMDLPVSSIAPLVVPHPDSPVVKRMGDIGCCVVPHHLHMYKEPLDAKFGYATFFINQTTPMVDHSGIHDLVLEWISSDLANQLSAVKARVSLGQPPECHSSVPFLCALNQECSLLDPRLSRDSKKLETFLLSKVSFTNDAKNAHKNERGDPASELPPNESNECSPSDWNVVGSLKASALTAKEIVWLKREHSQFPALQVVNGDFSRATCGTNELKSFLETALHPLIEVTL